MPSTNWTIHIGAPSELFSALWHSALALIIGALVLSLCLFLGCAVQRRRFLAGENPARLIAPAGSNRGRHGGDEMSEAPG